MTTMTRTVTHMKGRVQQLRYVSWARIVSDILSPPAVWAAVALPIALSFSQTVPRALLWWATFSVLICLLPVAFIGAMVMRGKIGDIHMKERRERYWPLLITVALSVVACVILRWMAAPPVLILLALFSLVQVSVIGVVTLMWQISMHTMGITGATIAAGLMLSMGTAVIMTPLIVLVGAARLSLSRHTPAQIIAGALVGAITPLIIILLIPHVVSGLIN